MRQDVAVAKLLILTENALLPHDVERLSTLYPADEYQLHVCIPARDADKPLDRADEVVEDVARTAFGEIREDLESDSPVDDKSRASTSLTTSINDLTSAGFTTDGELVGESPVEQVVKVAMGSDVETIIVITSPHWLDEVLRRDWATRIHRQLKHDHREIPVLHFIAGTDQVVN